MFRFILLAVLLLPHIAAAQSLTVEEAKEIVRQLGTKKILSPKGVDKLNATIDAQAFLRLKQPVFSNQSFRSNPATTAELSKSQLIYFLGYVFDHEAIHRSGLLEMRKVMMEFTAEYQNKVVDEASQRKMKEELDHKLKGIEAAHLQLPGVQLEMEVKKRTKSESEITFFGGNVITVGSRSRPDVRNVLSLDGYGYIHDSRSALGTTVNQVLEDLQVINLLPKIDFSQPKGPFPIAVREGKYLLYAAEEVAREEDKSYITTTQLKIAKQLLDTDALAQEQFTALTEAISTKPLVSKSEYLPYLKKVFVFDLDEYSEDPQEAIVEIFRNLSGSIPEIEPTGITVQAKVNPMWAKQQFFSASFELKGAKYTSPVFHLVEPDSPERLAEQPGFYKLQPSTAIVNGFNQWLIDRNSNQRLFFQQTEQRGYEARAFTLVLLDEAQRAAFGKEDEYDSFLTGTGFQKIYTTTMKEDLHAYFKSIGLFKHLSQEELVSSESCRRAHLIKNPWDLLDCYPKISVIIDDWESGNIDNPYEELTKQFAEASKGSFIPTEILDDFSANWEKKETNYGFTLNSNEYAMKLPMMSDWLDPRFIDLINEALSKEQVGGKFYSYRGVGNIFLTDKQYSSLSQRMPKLFEHIEH